MIVLATATVIGWLMALWSAAGLVRGPGILRRVRRLFGTVVWTSISLLLTTLLVVLYAFHSFAGETLVAHVATQRLSPHRFELTYTPVVGESATVPLEGDQWSVSGGVVKWHPWLTALGVKNYHKPMRLSGQFSDLDQQRTHLPTVYALEPFPDRVWETFYWASPHLPLIEAVYGSSAYVYAEPGVRQDVYVTPSGYMIKREKKN